MNSQHPNRLSFEKSPYLLQHAYNPVAWYPWGPEALAKAHKENKPIFLSIGYSTCHWCHVMEHESFEDEETAQLLNDHFVAVKVDREERPDIDSIYMSFVTATTGSGGWPLSVFLTPQTKPFYGGTYFPPEARYGSPGFKDLLWSVHSSWLKQEDKVRESGDQMVESLSQRVKAKSPSDKVFTKEILAKAFGQLDQNFDVKNGGFGHSPKFPMGHTLSFLLRYWKNNDDKDALEIVEKTLTAMAQGGINDQLGGGFHRYATDVHWQVPHFEKMLYDQALLTKIYLEAYAATGKEIYADTARETLDYVLRDMRDKKGGFYSAEDADSLELDADIEAEKKEGAFYLWGEEELRNILTADEFVVINVHFGIAKNGNAEFDPHGEFVGKNILHMKHSLDETAVYCKKSIEDVRSLVASAKVKLFEHRAARPRPHLDDKILVDWNGLMISSLAVAGRILKDERYLQAAEMAAQFILQQLKNDEGRLLHRYRDHEAGILAGLEDYVFLIAGLLDLYENSFDRTYFAEALRLNQEMVSLFWDEEHGGLYLTPKDGEELILRPKEVYDGAVPSGNSLAALNFLRIYHFNFTENDLKNSEAIFKVFHDEVMAHPSAFTQMMMALQFYFGPVKDIVLEGDIKQGAGREMLDLILSKWLPQKTLTIKEAENTEAIVYVCENQICHQPVKDAAALSSFIQ